MILSLVAWLFPLAVWGLKDRPAFIPLLLALLLVLIVYKLSALPRQLRWFSTIFTVSLGLGIALKSTDSIYRLYPFLMSASALLIFLQAKRAEDNPMLGPVERWRPKSPHLLADLQRTKIIWIVGLSANSLIFAAFLFGFSTEAWMLYATFYSYLFLGFLMVMTWMAMAYFQWRRRP